MSELSAAVEHKNQLVETVVLMQPACRMEFRIKASKALLAQARREAAKEVGKEVALPGFRKGRAPEEMLLKQYPKEIDRRVPNKLADLAFAQAQGMARVPLLNNNAKVTFDLKTLTDEGAELIYHFETEPKVPVVDPKLFVPQEVKQAEVGEKRLEEAILQARYFLATWKEVEDRPIQDKDTAIIDLDSLEGEVPTRVFNQVRFEVSKDRMADWMYNLVVGAKKGDLLEGLSEPDAEASEQEKAEFQPKKVRVAIIKIEEPELPPLDDEFAKKLGAADLDTMRQMIFTMLTSQAEHGAKEQLREQVNHFLLTHYFFDLPQSLIQSEKEHRQHQLMESPQFKRDWNKMNAEERSTLEEKLAKESSDAVRLFYLSRQLIQQAKVVISRQEVQRMAVNTIQQERGPAANVDQIPREVYALAFAKVMLTKAQDFILGDSQK